MLQKLVTFLYATIAVSILCSCDLVNREGILLEALENIEFECHDGVSSFFFKGKFLEDSICIYDQENGFGSFFGLGSGFVTMSPSFTLEEIQLQSSKSFVDMGFQGRSTIEDRLEEIRVTSEPQKFGTRLDSMVRIFIVPGVHQIRGMVDGVISEHGFEVLLNKWYANPELNPDKCNMTLSSALGQQPSSSRMRILEVYLDKDGQYYVGHVLLDFVCKMYFWNAGDITGDFAGDFSGTFRLPIRYKP